MTWLTTSLQWYMLLLSLGLIFFPLTKMAFGRFVDHGYPFSKTIAILLVTYSIFVLGIIKVLPYSWLGIVGVIAVFGYLNWRLRSKTASGSRNESGMTKKILIIEEVLFFLSFLFLAYMRGQEPSLRSLEKFMDFGFMQSILRSNYFPPADMWYSGHPINYYYFGHLSGATLIKLAQVPPSQGYNLVLATLFGLAVTQSFSLVANLAKHFSTEIKKTVSTFRLVLTGLIGAVLVNISGNLHTIYTFTKGYPNDKPIEFWKILSGFNSANYWYPNATRFIPYTIHEFPSYSYVVADLHGHVFDIPFVLLTIALLFVFFTSTKNSKLSAVLDTLYSIRFPILFGFMTAIHYMTNAFDGPIYLLLIFLISYFLFRDLKQFGFFFILTTSFFILFSLPFSLFFKPFAGSIGVNCAPAFLTKLQKIGPFLFEKGNCQLSPLWMMFLLWGFFWISLAILLLCIRSYRKQNGSKKLLQTDLFVTILLSFGFFLVWIPEFFYIKDIYPGHFRANTMFKLGYQTYIMSSIGVGYILFRVSQLRHTVVNSAIRALLSFCLFLVLLYPFLMIVPYYGTLNKTPDLDGFKWLQKEHPASAEIVAYLNEHEPNQLNILEAQGDSYTDLDVVSSYTGNPTVAGWFVHEWLWRGGSQVFETRTPDITAIYESTDLLQTITLLKKYKIDYVVVTPFEREKYKNLYEKKFEQIGVKILSTKDGFGALYRVN